MSDGSYRSLQMRPHWKVAAQRAANLTHSTEEVGETMEYALKKDILEAPIATVRDIMNSDTLFPDMRIDELEILRARHSRSSATNSLIDCAIEVAAAGATGENGTVVAVAATLEELARPAMRSIDEHYQREAGARASRMVRTRLEDTFCKLNCVRIARELLALACLPVRRSVVLPRRTGLDEGPRL
jgi:hypothetical protein